MNRQFALLSARESGQALIFVAVLLPLLIGVLGLAVEGGLTFVEYRHMQAAADMAALMGAQDLPNNTTQAISDACLFAQRNGYDNCTTGGSSTTTVCVPPRSLSPYNGLNYQAGSSACLNSSTGKAYFIEVQIQKQFQLFPIFAQNLGLGNFTLSAHAIARAGAPSPTDYAITILDNTASAALTLGGNKGVVVVGPVISDSSASNSITTLGSATQIACNGTWYTAASEAAPSNLQTQSGGAADFSPPDCLPIGSYDNPVAFFDNQAPVPDPYCSSMSPPTGVVTSQDSCNPTNPNTNSVQTMSNCSECNYTAWYYQWSPNSTPPSYGRNTGTWQQATNGFSDQGCSGCSFELFPGIYYGDIKIVNKSTTIYLNPGVYTITGNKGIDSSGGNVCVYGAPACDVGIDGTRTTIPYQGTVANCSTADMTNSNSYYVDPGTWYYYCSPWGIWDSASLPGRPGALSTAPTFVGSTTPLNGVTFYFTGGGSYSMNGNSFEYVAFPNPCPGTGSLTPEGTSPGSVSFQAQVNPTATGAGQTGWPEPSGATPGAGVGYTYPAQSLPKIDGLTQSPSDAWVYPNVDFTLNGECERYNPSTYAGDVWQGEMPAPAGYPGLHVHFLSFARNGSSGIKWNGNGLQNFWGILYDPGTQGCGNACQVQLTGTSGAGSPIGPPMLVGQMVADNASITGSATVEVFYRPCDPTVESCGSGAGSGLVE